MTLLARRREARLAEVRVQRQRMLWQIHTNTLRAHLSHDRGVIAVCAGAATGFACGLMPMRGIARGARIVASIAAFALRTPIGAMLFEGIKRGATSQNVARKEQSQ